MLRSRRRRNRIAFAVALAVSLTTLLLLSEFSARLYIATRTPYLYYAHGPFSKLKMHMESFGLVFDDYLGDDYSVINGARTVVGQPATYDRTLWLFGNSGTFDMFVNDSQTMAGKLQALLLTHNLRWRIVNLSMVGAGVPYELARMRATNVRPGDIVLFVDDVWPASDCPTSTRLDNLAIYQLACSLLPQTFPRANTEFYLRTISVAQSESLLRRVTFVHLIQACVWPTPTGGYRLSAPPEEFTDSCHLNARGDARTAREVYNALTTF